MPNYIPDDTIPQALYAAIIQSQIEYGQELKEFLRGQPITDMPISVTSLIGAPQRKILSSRHHHEMYVDPVKDLWPSFMGNCIHLVLENQAKKNPDYLVEFRMGMVITVDGKKFLVHGKLDLYSHSEQALEDWKITRPTSILYDKTDHIMQLNVLRMILKANGYPVKNMTDVYMFPHLDNTKVGKIEGYPTRNATMIQAPSLPDKDVMEYIYERVKKHWKNKDLDDEDLDECTDAERWIRGSTFKVYFRKKGKGVQDFSSKAAHYFTDKVELEKWAVDHDTADGEEYEVKEYKGSPKACDYCDSRPFCNQWREEHSVAKPLFG